MVDELPDVVIRPATVADAPQIARIHIASWREAHAGVVPADYLAGLDVEARTRAWQDVLRDAGEQGTVTSVQVAEDEGELVGFVSVVPSRDEDAERNTLEIATLYIVPGRWGHGVARELMRAALADVPEAPVTLWVLAANERARHFYRRHGFAADGVERLDEFGGEMLKVLRYRRG